MSKLARTKDRFGEWVALGCIEVDTLCERYLKTAEDWEKNFRISRAKGQELMRLSL
jgi:hypothetical protein